MAKHPDKKVILCAHFFDMENESQEFKSLVANSEQIICLFCGHKHVSKIITTGEDAGNKPIIYTGHYCYSSDPNPLKCLMGYREVVIYNDKITSKYIIPSHTYNIEKVKFTNEYTEQDQIEIKF